MSRLVRLLSGGWLLVAVHGLPGCGGDDFSAPEASAGGQGGAAGSSAGGGAGQGGAGMSGSSGQAGAGQAGAAGEAGQAGAGTAGEAGAAGDAGAAGEAGAAGAAGAAGDAGQAGEAGQGGAGQAGQAGGGMSGESGQGGEGGGSTCMCEPPKDLCGKSVCDSTNTCLLVPDENHVPADTKPGDCRRPFCEGFMTKEVPDESDAPAPLGSCGTVFCSGSGMPVHSDTDSLCPANKRCQDHECECRPCPNSGVPGLPAGQCAMTLGTQAIAKGSTDKTAAQAVDRNPNTFWSGGGQLEISFDSSQPMGSLVVWTHPTTIPVEVEATLTLSSDLPVLTLTKTFISSAVNSSQVEFTIDPPRAVQGALLTLKSSQTVGVNEITFRMCP